MGKKFNELKQLYQQNMLTLQGLLDQRTNPIEVISPRRKAYTTMLSSKDRMLCSNRYVWENLPINLTSQQLESMFYSWGSLCFFEKENSELCISRYAKIGQLTDYGTLDKIQPITFAGKTYDIERTVLTGPYDPPLEDTSKVAVVIFDYTGPTQAEVELSRNNISLTTTIADQTEVYMQLYNNIRLSIKKALALCENEEQKDVIAKQVARILNSNEPIVPIALKNNQTKALKDILEMFNFDKTFDTTNYCQTIDYYDKIRLKFNGIPSADTFEKKERLITSEQDDQNAHTNLVLYDGLEQRKNGLALMKRYFKNPAIQRIEVRLHDCLKEKQQEYVQPFEQGGNNGNAV